MSLTKPAPDLSKTVLTPDAVEGRISFSGPDGKQYRLHGKTTYGAS